MNLGAKRLAADNAPGLGNNRRGSGRSDAPSGLDSCVANQLTHYRRLETSHLPGKAGELLPDLFVLEE